MINEQWRSARRILVVRLDNLGDVLVTTPAIHAIKTSLPEVSLTLLTSPVGAQVGWLNPDIDDVIIYQAPWMDPWHLLPQDRWPGFLADHPPQASGTHDARG